MKLKILDFSIYTAQVDEPEICSGWAIQGIFIRYSSLAAANLTLEDVKRKSRLAFAVPGKREEKKAKTKYNSKQRKIND